MEDTTVRCWGNNSNGQLGDGNPGAISWLPVTVQGLTGTVDIAGGVSHTCAALTSGSVACWGDNTYGQLGNGTNTQSPIPVSVDAGDAVAVAAGYWDSCALTSGGAIRCWGYSHEGELGNGTNDDSNVPVLVAYGFTGVTMPALNGARVCALGDWTWTGFPGSVLCWGYAPLGDGGGNSNVPVEVLGGVVAPPLPLFGEYRVAVGAEHGCVMGTEGSVNCWGDNSFGQFGNGTQVGNPLAVFGPPDRDHNNLAAGEFHTCVRERDGSIICFGRNDSGQLGDNFAEPFSLDPVDVLGIGSSTVQLSSGSSTNCVVMIDSTVRCWGSGDTGELGNGTYGTANCGASSPACAPVPTEVLLQVGSSTTMTSNQNPIVFQPFDGNLVLLARPISSYAGAGGYPGGVITFYEGKTELCTLSEPPGGWLWKCPVPQANSQIGHHVYTAVYDGDTWDVGSSVSYDQTVLDAADYVFAAGFDS